MGIAVHRRACAATLFLLLGRAMNTKLVRNGLLAAGFMNVFGVLVFSRLFTNVAVNEADPAVMSNFGLLMIALWGLAYIGAAKITANIKWLVGAFAVEKLVYVVAWLMWQSSNNLGELYSKDFFAGAFFSIYGVNDAAFMLFFAWVFFSQHNDKCVSAIAPN